RSHPLNVLSGAVTMMRRAPSLRTVSTATAVLPAPKGRAMSALPPPSITCSMTSDWNLRQTQLEPSPIRLTPLGFVLSTTVFSVTSAAVPLGSTVAACEYTSVSGRELVAVLAVSLRRLLVLAVCERVAHVL